MILFLFGNIIFLKVFFTDNLKKLEYIEYEISESSNVRT